MRMLAPLNLEVGAHGMRNYSSRPRLHPRSRTLSGTLLLPSTPLPKWAKATLGDSQWATIVATAGPEEEGETVRCKDHPRVVCAGPCLMFGLTQILKAMFAKPGPEWGYGHILRDNEGACMGVEWTLNFPHPRAPGKRPPFHSSARALSVIALLLHSIQHTLGVCPITLDQALDPRAKAECFSCGCRAA